MEINELTHKQTNNHKPKNRKNREREREKKEKNEKEVNVKYRHDGSVGVKGRLVGPGPPAGDVGPATTSSNPVR